MSDQQSSPPEFTNRLAREKSPYLLQHAHNPVDWFPWGDEAFTKARSEDKPILLSIGYATCHWCHVMERESFEDRDTARLLNELFVPIKVDREERPDVDQIYMKALHATGQQGGWPLNMFLTPDLLPVTGGTYFPPQPAYGRPSFRQVLENISKLWNENRGKLTESADTLHAFLKQGDAPAADSALPDQSALDATAGLYESIYDPFRGGFAGNGPNKFPPSMGLVFLLEYYRRSGKPMALQMVEETLDAMRRGGIYDQVGGGLSRYATDHDWLVPHFEKMLYDNALFLRALVEAYRVTGNARYREWALDLHAYIRRDMTSPEGAFYSAEDADSEGEEGKFYVWTHKEIEAVLSQASISLEDSKLLVEFWGVSTRGNFEGKTILNERMPRERFLASLSQTGADQKSEAQWKALREQARTALRAARDKRERPLRDDKILTSWNALYISALAQAAIAFEEPALYGEAARAADFIFDQMSAPAHGPGAVFRRYRDGEAGVQATLPDYALLGNACLDLYRAGFEPRWFARARDLAGYIETNFRDESGSGAFFETEAGAADLIVRTIETYDGVEPSGNAAAARLFLTLALYGDRPAENRALCEGVLRYNRAGLSEQGASHSYLGTVLANYLSPPPEIAVVFRAFDPATARTAGGEAAAVLAKLSRLSGETIVAVRGAGISDTDAATVPLLADKSPGADAGEATVYVCRNLACATPVHTAAELEALLKSSSD